MIAGLLDATLNPGGVWLGTSEFYAVVDAVDGVADSLVVHLEDTDDARREPLLFVAPAEGRQVDDDLRATIATAFRSEPSPRPDVLNSYIDYASRRSTVR